MSLRYRAVVNSSIGHDELTLQRRKSSTDYYEKNLTKIKCLPHLKLVSEQ